ncbi:transcriptional regulator [Luteimicrobium album]|uniref:Lactose phosphotransferase system repressor n=1 Tax=Luteimicrobium album TaxID=1054550 RepID=A0ABQ6I616_9MICO|nr:DeoR/GlpR family DNA-binding transcription regulator [Luteimicrobium album]GMA25394.1 transcriptional regulator [Luteimicrobium album]
MGRLTGDERRRLILETLRSAGHTPATRLAEDLGVAPETVRRDLTTLEGHGLVRRTHGGAYPVEGAAFETNLAARSTAWVAEKQRIAAATVEHLGPTESLFLDEGYTQQLIAEELVRSGRALTVVTASLPAAAALAASPTIEVVILGGRLRPGTLAPVDQWTTSMLEQFVIDLAILGANGITRDKGLTVPNGAVAAVKSTAMRVSRRRVFVGAHHKFGITSFCRFAQVTDFEALITDTGLPSSEAHRYAALGPQVLRA